MLKCSDGRATRVLLFKFVAVALFKVQLTYTHLIGAATKTAPIARFALCARPRRVSIPMPTP